MTKTKKRKDQMIHWYGDEYITPIDFIVKINSLISGPLTNLAEMEYDMYQSDCRSLCDARWRLHHAMNDLKKSGLI